MLLEEARREALAKKDAVHVEPYKFEDFKRETNHGDGQEEKEEEEISDNARDEDGNAEEEAEQGAKPSSSAEPDSNPPNPTTTSNANPHPNEQSQPDVATVSGPDSSTAPTGENQDNQQDRTKDALEE